MSTLQIPLVTATATLAAAVLAASVTLWNERRKRLLEARQTAYAKATSTLQLIRQHVVIDQMFAVQIDALRGRLRQTGDPAELRDVVRDTVESLERRRDRLLDHVLRPLLEAEAAVQVFGSARVNRAMEEASALVVDILGPEPGAFDAVRFDAAVRSLREAVRGELRIR
ncbi:hypothetical protein [Micromonospora endolithica]|uniref:Uncharacterized protein n=1 Tax=Micromonospora endolithica TaxID=230091 RepID=A0A3A9ZIM8_9ACTN|nr:hypothetical protein [Micromonospora endolithica]RKN48203.1 hypothetical protein D7223_09180 [Micromonospora endolithica]TWJ24761.1 hypothetical protein JD76_04917 [Micromonospora endolithica]